jgi:hypothetical protein
LLLKPGLLGILLLRSRDAQLLVVLVEFGGLLLMLPLDSFRVVIPPVSFRVFFSMVAAASELEN